MNIYNFVIFRNLIIIVFITGCVCVCARKHVCMRVCMRARAHAVLCTLVYVCLLTHCTVLHTYCIHVCFTIFFRNVAAYNCNAILYLVVN